jgi:hypothetical protein
LQIIVRKDLETLFYDEFSGRLQTSQKNKELALTRLMTVKYTIVTCLRNKSMFVSLCCITGYVMDDKTNHA